MTMDTILDDKEHLGGHQDSNKGTLTNGMLPHNTGRCECMMCGLYFTSPSAFDMHLTKTACKHPSLVTKRDGQPLMELKPNGYWGGVGSFDWSDK